MTWLSKIPPFIALIAPLFVLAGCPGDSPVDEDDDGTDDGLEEPLVCVDPGSFLLDNVAPAKVPGPGDPAFSCSSGWATDAPQLDGSWTIEIPLSLSQFNFSAMRIGAHPDGGVVLAATGLFARYDADGEQLWNNPTAIPSEADMFMLVEASGTIVLSTYEWSGQTGSVRRYDADGEMIGAVTIPWNSASASVWGLASFGDDLIVGAFDADAEGSWESTLMRLDPDGNLLLRKSSNMAGTGLLAVNDSGTASFGAFPNFLVSLDNGAVLGSLTPSVGNPSSVVGFGDDFLLAGLGGGDFTVGRYSETGSERWLQTYDRATLNDVGRAIDVGLDGTIVAGGNTSTLNSSDNWWFGSQPWVVGLNADGDALWADRISAIGDVTGVAIGSGGEVFVAGLAQGHYEPNQDPPLIAWLRRYDP